MKLTDKGMCTVRGIAAVTVVLDHAVQVFLARLLGLDSHLVQFAGWMGRQAVVVFFIISGYLITQSIMNNVRRNGGQFDFIEYTAARIARIYPPLLFAILVVLAGYFLLIAFGLPGAASAGAQSFALPGDLYTARDRFSIQWWDIPYALLMNNGLLVTDGPLWTLCIEWLLYFVAAFIGLGMTARRWPYRILLFTVALLVFLHLERINENALLFTLIWGMGGAVSVAHHFGRNLAGRARAAVLALAAVSAAGIILSGPWRLFHEVPGSLAAYGFQLVFCVLYLALLFPLRPVEATKGRQALIKLGDFSYTLYIVHFPIMLCFLAVTVNFTGHDMGRAVLCAVLALPVVLVSAYAGAAWFEQKSRFKPMVRSMLDRVRDVARLRLSRATDQS